MASLPTPTSDGQRSPTETDKRERKRQQNRIAQQNYRRNLKQRIKALEAVALSRSPDACIAVLTSPPPSSCPPIASAAMPCFPTDPSCEEQSGANWPSIDTVTVWAETPCHQPAEPALLPSRDEEGRTALHRAVYTGNESMARLLLDHGADITKHDSNGSTALHVAAETGSETMVRLLLGNSADPNQTDFLSRSALFLAIQSQNEAVTQILLESGSVNINLADSMGNVPLHAAVESGSEGLTLLLLQYGANIDA